MTSLNQEWIDFQNYIDSDLTTNTIIQKSPKSVKKEMPKCSDIYISTQTKIAYLNKTIDLNEVFWKIPMIEY